MRNFYLEAILTVIAVCLVLLVAKSFLPVPAVAGKEEILRVDICKIGGYYVTKWEILNIGKDERR